MEQAESARRTLFEPEPQPEVVSSAAQPIVVTAPVDHPVVEDEPDEEPLPHRFNPWLAVLWVLGLVLVASGSFVNWLIYSQSVNSDPFADGEAYWALVSVVQTFAPWFVGVGLAAVVAAVLIHALDWRERQP